MSPYNQATSSIRSTTLMGLVLQTTARDLRRQLLATAAEQGQTLIDKLFFRDGAVKTPESRHAYAAVIARYSGLPVAN